jgi:tetratricopeptide (TPR) repeat protein
MFRPLALAAFAYLLICTTLLGRKTFGRNEVESPRIVAHEGTSGLANLPDGAGKTWFANVRSSCNAVEAESRVASTPPPEGRDGSAYAAACFALAGKLDRSRNLIQQLPAADRSAAAGVVFEVGHAVADDGDEKSAAPLLELVLSYQPDNQLALYHLGLAEQSTYKYDAARKHLQRFVDLHPASDALRQNAEKALEFLERM